MKSDALKVQEIKCIFLFIRGLIFVKRRVRRLAERRRGRRLRESEVLSRSHYLKLRLSNHTERGEQNNNAGNYSEKPQKWLKQILFYKLSKQG